MTDQREVTAIFYDPESRCTRTAKIKIPTGLSASVMATRHAAQDHARDHGMPLFAIPYDPSDPDTRWLVFRVTRQMANLEREFPNREAADMWLVLGGGR